MKTYFLIFDGDPRPHFEKLKTLGRIEMVALEGPLHCIALPDLLLEQMVVNTLQAQSSRLGVYLIPAVLPIHPAPGRSKELEIRRLIALGDDGFAGISSS